MKRTQSLKHHTHKLKQKERLLMIRDINFYCPEKYALRQGYFCLPSQQEIFANGGKCSSLIIGNTHGYVQWKGSIDISGLATSLRTTVIIEDRAIQVYPGDIDKPAVGKELNRSCLAVFKTALPTKGASLRKICQTNGTKLVKNYLKEKTFVILIPHFTRYTFHIPNSTKQTKQTNDTRSIQDIMMSQTVRSRVVENRNYASHSQIAPLITARIEAEIAQYGPSPTEEPNRVEDMLNGLKEYAMTIEENIREKESPFPQYKVTERPESLDAENQNRAFYRYKQYQEEAKNLPALQNYMFSAEGQIVQLKNYDNHQKLVFVQPDPSFQNFSEHTRNLLLSEISLNPQMLAQVICNERYQIALRRQLSLYAILFEAQVHFDFDKVHNYAPKMTSGHTINENYRLQLIKGWLTWRVRLTYKQSVYKYTPFRSKLMTALALRDPAFARNHLISNESWKSALILPCLQDPLFRKNLSSCSINDLEPEIQMVLQQKVEDLNCQQWLLCLGMVAWYFKKDSFNNNIFKLIDSDILKDKINEDQLLQFKLFQLYTVEKGFKLTKALKQHSDPSIELLMTQWMLMNRLHLSTYEKKAYNVFDDKKGKIKYQFYQYQVTRKIVQALAKSHRQQAKQFISFCPELSSTQKRNLIEIVDPVDNSFSQQIQNLIKNGQVLQALKKSVQAERPNDEVYRLATHQTLLCSYRHTVSKKYETILASRGQEFYDLLLINRFERDPRIGLAELLNMLDILLGKTRFKDYLCKIVKRRIQSAIENCLKKWLSDKIQMIHVLQYEKQICTQLLEIVRDPELRDALNGENFNLP